MTDLLEEEVIMNSPVIGASDVVGAQLKLQLIEHEAIPTEFPATLHLQVVGDAVQDYQFALEIEGGGHFPQGLCEHQKRTVGRDKDRIEVIVTNANAKVWAGWAIGHEAVKLTEPITFATQQLKKPAALNINNNINNIEQPTWMATLVHELGCHVELGDLNFLQGRSIGVVKDVQHLQATVVETGHFQLSWALNDFVEFLLIVSDGAIFDSPQAVCHQQRIAMEPNQTIPIVQLSEGVTSVTVTALYSTRDSAKLFQTQPLHLTIPKQLEAPKRDPQHEVDNRVRADAIQEQIQRLKDRKQQAAHEARHRANSEDHQSRDEIQQLQPPNQRHHFHDYHDQLMEPPKHRQPPRMMPHDEQTVVAPPLVPSGRSYYVATAILLLAPLATIQLCLRLSRQHKNRRRNL